MLESKIGMEHKFCKNIPHKVCPHEAVFCSTSVQSIEVAQKSVSKLLDEMAETGFQGRKLGEVVKVWEKMAKDPDTTIIMGYAGSMSTTGQRKLLHWLMENRMIDVLVPTGANISEDIVEAMGYKYWKGTHLANDAELLKTDFNRYYDVYGREVDYLPMIELIAEFIPTLKQNYPYSSREFLTLFGGWLNERNIDCLVSCAARNGVPMFCPAIVDSAYGDAVLVAQSKGFKLVLDQAGDFREFMKLGEKVKDVGVIYIGGGVPKDFIQLLAVSSPLQYKGRKIVGREGFVHEITGEGYYPHKYAIQITTDSPQWGGLSGCTLDEAISWGKIANTEDHITCYCDATIAMPLVVHALNEKTGGSRKGVDFSDVYSDLSADR